MFVVGPLEVSDLSEKGCDELLHPLLGDVESVDVWRKDPGDESDLEGGTEGSGFLSLPSSSFASRSFSNKFPPLYGIPRGWKELDFFNTLPREDTCNMLPRED